MKNRGAFMTDLDKMEIRDIPMPTPKEKEVLVELEYVGICGSDVHYFHDGRCGSYVVDGDFMLGHECAGTVVELGEGVENLKVGDRVALEPGITCGQCEFCKSGRYNLCPDVQFLATPPVQGCYENYIAFPENMCFKLPDNISTKEGALVEPLSVGMHAANQGNVQLGDSVVILGAGCIGLVTLLACKAHGATDITVVDVMDKRLDLAKELGASRTINGAKEDTVALLRSEELFGDHGVELVFECAGSTFTANQAVQIVARGGKIMMVGTQSKPVPIDFLKINREVTIQTSFRYCNNYPQTIEAIASGKFNVKDMVTHVYDYKDVQQAFMDAIDPEKKTDMVKGVIKVAE